MGKKKTGQKQFRLSHYSMASATSSVLERNIAKAATLQGHQVYPRYYEWGVL